MLQVLIFLKSNLPQFLFFLFPSPNLTILILILLLHPKHSTRREKITYICGLRTRIECERVSEHSTHSDRVTNIGYLLSLGASFCLWQIRSYQISLWEISAMSDIIYKSISFKTLKSQEEIKWESI